MTTEEKAKAYDEAIKRLEDINAGNCQKTFMFTEGLFDYIFPKLKESEDERMIKFIKKQLYNIKNTITDNYKLDTELTDAIEWLEKQAEHANFRNKIQIGDKVTRNQDGMLVNLSQLKRVAKPAEQKPAELTYDENGEPELNPFESALFSAFSDIWQRYLLGKGINVAKEVSEISDELLQAAIEMQKPAWSEEDATHYNRILKELNLQKEMPINASVIEEVKSDIIWLKSLKDRVQPKPKWKPSDGQLASITCAVRKMKESACYDSELVSLYQDLKKLREE